MRLLSVLSALGLGVFVAAWFAALQRRGAGITPVRRPGRININEASQQELMRSLGLDAETAERIVEHRPYPSKMDLLGRMVVPEEIYNSIKNRIAYKVS